MKILTLKPPLKNKLDRLKTPVGEIMYIGIDPNELINKSVVAIVGSRKPTPYGKQVTEQLATELSRAGVVIVSGLAFGVDIIAHKAVLACGGKTIAVLASGLDNIYPASHARYAKQITEHGSVISEYSSDHMPRSYDFLERNRIIAGFSDIIIIPEATEKSGSLNTAKHAKSMNIPICAVPGPINSPLSSGTNLLIKQGAHLITSSQDILKLLNIKPEAIQLTLTGGNETETLVLQAIAGGIQDISLIEQETKLSTKDLQTSLTMLEISGQVRQDAVGLWHLS
ncbi:DNA-processing protein DprA [Candidatus Saccharibacteria bacterium]|nr:DNA-processing protein DprA [Candidatus Saccharibacteria bacterium]